MIVELGNARPHNVTPDKPVPGPAVTAIEIPDDYTVTPGADATELMRHIVTNPDVTNLPGHEAFLAIVHRNGVWGGGAHGTGVPAWVHVVDQNDPDKAIELERLLADFYGCARGRPDDIEDTHYTRSGPPGVGPAPEPAPEA